MGYKAPPAPASQVLTLAEKEKIDALVDIRSVVSPLQMSGTALGLAAARYETLVGASPDPSHEITLDASLANHFYVILDADCTLLNPVNAPGSGVWSFWVWIEQGVGAPFTLAYDTKYLECPSTPFPTLGTAEASLSLAQFLYIAAADACILVATVGPIG